MRHQWILGAILCLVAVPAWSVSEGLEDGSNNVSSGAVQFTVPDTLTGTLAEDGSGGVDYFKWNAVAGTQYNINGTSSGIPALDLGIDIENSLGQWVTGADSGGAGQPESFSFTAPASDVYYLVAYRADTTATGASYSISVASVSSINDWELY